MSRNIIVVSILAAIWTFVAAACFAGFSENPALPRLRQVTDKQWGDKYAMASTANPGTFVITTSFYETEDTFDAPGDAYPTRWNDHLVIGAYCYETNTETSITLSTWKQGPSHTIVSGGFPLCYYWTWHFSPKDPIQCIPSISWADFGPEFMEIVKVDVTKDALPPAAGQPYGKLFATVKTEVTKAGGPWPEAMLWAFEVSRNTAGQPTITPVPCPHQTFGGYTPGYCYNEYFEPQESEDRINQSLYSFTGNEYPGLIRYTMGANKVGDWDMIEGHCVTINKRPGSPATYEAWVFWNETRITDYAPGTWYKKRIFGYRLTGTEQWAVLPPTTLRPDMSEPQPWYPMSMDACYDPVGGKVWFQISECNYVFEPSTGVTTACWLPSNFVTRPTEGAFYADEHNYNDAAATPVGGELLLSDQPMLCEGSIDSTYHTGAQGCVYGAFHCWNNELKVYRINSTTTPTFALNPSVLQERYTVEVPDVTCFGSPAVTSQYGRPAGTSYAYNNPNGGVVAMLDGSTNNIDTSLFENNEVSAATLHPLTKCIPLSQNYDGNHFSQVDLTKENHWLKVSQVKKRLDQSAGSTARDRELFYTWMGKDAQDNKFLAIKHSSSQAFKFGINPQSDCYQWSGNNLERLWSSPCFFGDGNWLNGYYDNGALVEFRDAGLPGFRSGDQIFNAIFEGYIGGAYDYRNSRYVNGNELVYSQAFAALIDNPYDFNDPAIEGQYPFITAGQTGWRSTDVSPGWNFFGERPWDYNYFQLRLPDWYLDEGAVLSQNARLWCYWLDWQ